MGSVPSPSLMTSDGKSILNTEEGPTLVPNSMPRCRGRVGGRGWMAHNARSPPHSGACGSRGEVGHPHRQKPTPSFVAQDQGRSEDSGSQRGAGAVRAASW